VGHAGAVCWQNKPQQKRDESQQRHDSKQHSKPMHTVASTLLNSNEEDLNNNPLSVHKTSSRHSGKLTTVLEVDGVALEMEVDTRAELSTIPVAIYQQQLCHFELHTSHQVQGDSLQQESP